MSNDVKGLEYAAGMRAPVDGQNGYVTVVDATGFNYEYAEPGTVLGADVDTAYVIALLAFYESEEIKPDDEELNYLSRARYVRLEDYFVHGFDDPITTAVGSLRWTVIGTAPTLTYGTQISFNYSANFTLCLCDALTDPLVDVAAFTSMSFLQEIDSSAGTIFVGMADDVVASATNMFGVELTPGANVRIHRISPGGGDSTTDTGIPVVVSSPQAIKLVSASAGAAVEVFVDGVSAGTHVFAATSLMCPQVDYGTPSGATVTTQMYFSFVKTCAGAMILDGNLD